MLKLASIEKIHSLISHPNPEVERLECAKIKEWPVVIPKGQYKDGELVVFIQIDSIVPATETFKFMERQKYRIWNARFKGAPSSGLVQPLSILPPKHFMDLSLQFQEGEDVSEILGVTKYEKALDTSLGGDAKAHFPTDIISISDEDNALSYPESFIELIGKEIYISQKADGSSTTFIYNTHPDVSGGEFRACSRRLELKEGSGFPWQAVQKYDIKTKLEKLGMNIAIQAESIGPKLNGNKMELKEMEIRVFRMKNLDTREIFELEELIKTCDYLDVPMVKIIDRFTYDPAIHTIEYFRKLADSQVWDTNGKPAEGIVIAPTVPFWSPTLKKSWSVKIINQDYKQ